MSVVLFSPVTTLQPNTHTATHQVVNNCRAPQFGLVVSPAVFYKQKKTRPTSDMIGSGHINTHEDEADSAFSFEWWPITSPGHGQQPELQEWLVRTRKYSVQ